MSGPEPRPLPTIGQPPSGFCIWRDERLPILQIVSPNLNEEELRTSLEEEWRGMNSAQQSPYHLESQQQGVDSGYNAADLLCIYCMCRSADIAEVGWQRLTERHALNFASGAYENDAQLALSTFMRSRNGLCWFCPVCAEINVNQYELLVSREVRDDV